MATTPNYGPKIVSKAVRPATQPTTATPLTAQILGTPPSQLPNNIHFVKFDDVGHILFRGNTSPAGYDLMVEMDGEHITQGDADINLDWVDGHAIVRRPENPTVLDGMTLRNLPIPCVITVDGVAHDSTDETAELSFSQPGTFTVKVSAFPMLDAIFQVTQT